MSIKAACKMVMIIGLSLLEILIEPVLMLADFIRRRLLKYRTGGDIPAVDMSAIEELDNPCIHHTRSRIMKYYASVGRYLSFSEIDEFTHYARYCEASSINYSNQKVIPYVLGEYTNTSLNDVYVANDNKLRCRKGIWHNRHGRRIDKDVEEERQRKKDEAIIKVLDNAIEQIAELNGKGRFGTIKYSKKQNVIKNIKMIINIIRNITKNNGGNRV